MKLTLSSLIICLVALSVPFNVKASPISSTNITEVERNYFLKTIAELTKEVVRLQTILQQRLTEQRVCTLPNVSLFEHQIETSYCVKSGKLINQNGEGVRPTDQALFNLFSAVVGSDVVDQQVLYWRIFSDDDAITDAFVETVSDDNHYMVSVNRFGYFADDEMIKKSYAELFTHEYAHLVLLKQPELVKEFKEKFWTSADSAEASKLEKLSQSYAMKERVLYFNKNSERFVSDYATQSVAEDMAETFLSVVINGWPDKSANSLKAKKQRFFQTNKNLSVYKEMIDTNLVNLDILKREI